jgi:hypothetical protein
MKKNKNIVTVSGKRSEPYSKGGIYNDARSETGVSLLAIGIIYGWAWSNLHLIARMTGYSSLEKSRNGS